MCISTLCNVHNAHKCCDALVLSYLSQCSTPSSPLLGVWTQTCSPNAPALKTQSWTDNGSRYRRDITSRFCADGWCQHTPLPGERRGRYYSPILCIPSEYKCLQPVNKHPRNEKSPSFFRLLHSPNCDVTKGTDNGNMEHLKRKIRH